MTIKCIKTNSNSETSQELFPMTSMERGSVAYCPEKDCYVLHVVYPAASINLIVKGKGFSNDVNTLRGNCTSLVRKINKDEIITLELS